MKHFLLGLGSLCILSLNAAEYTVNTVNGIPRIECDGQPLAQRLYMGNWMHIPTAKMAADAGVRLYQILDYYLVWDGQPDSAFEKFDRYAEEVLAADPKVLLIPRIKLDDREPPFLKNHPECLDRQENGNPVIAPGNRKTPSIASPLYRSEIRKALHRTIRHLEEKFSDRIAGYQPCYGNGSEWLYQNWSTKGHWGGYDVSTRNAFQAWLKNRYKTNDALAKAWNRPEATFSTVQVPSSRERKGRPDMIFLAPQKSQNVIDFNLFLSDNMADALLESMKAVRDVCGKRKLTCAFYGYSFESAGSSFQGPSPTGHYGLRKVLDSPDVDVLVGPYSYLKETRCLGGGAACHTAGESVSLAGKLWLNEDDNGTHLSWPHMVKHKIVPDFATHRLRDLSEALKIYRRNLAFNYMRGYAGWWMDLWGAKWQNDPALWAEMKRFLPLEKKIMENPTPFTPDIALILDETSIAYRVARNEQNMAEFSSYLIRDKVSRSSVTYGQYLLSDVLSGKAENSKLDIHCTTNALTGKQRQYLAKRAKRVATIWLLAPGYIDLDKNRFSIEAIKELTGFSVKKENPSSYFSWTTAEGMIRGIPPHLGLFGAKAPFFSIITEPGDIVLTTFPGNRPSIVYRPAQNGRAAALFCATNELPPELIRFMAEKGGAKVWCEENLHVQSRGNFASFTAPHAGTFEINTGWNSQIRDALTGENLGNGPKITRHIDFGDTLIIEKAD